MSSHTVSQCFKTTWHKNLASGHEWPEHTPINKWKVTGGISLGREFSSEKKAQEHTDFLNATYPPEYIRWIQSMPSKITQEELK